MSHTDGWHEWEGRWFTDEQWQEIGKAKYLSSTTFRHWRWAVTTAENGKLTVKRFAASPTRWRWSGRRRRGVSWGSTPWSNRWGGWRHLGNTITLVNKAYACISKKIHFSPDPPSLRSPSTVTRSGSIATGARRWQQTSDVSECQWLIPSTLLAPIPEFPLRLLTLRSRWGWGIKICISCFIFGWVVFAHSLGTWIAFLWWLLFVNTNHYSPFYSVCPLANIDMAPVHW